MIYDKIVKEKQRIEKQIETLERQLENLPEGKLVCTKNGKYSKWYHTTNSSYTYIPKKEPKPAEPFETKRNTIPGTNNKTDKYSPTYKILESLKQSENNNVALNILKDSDVIYTSSQESKKEQTIETHNETVKEQLTGIKKEVTLVIQKEISNEKPKTIIKENVQMQLFDNKFLSEESKKKHRFIVCFYSLFFF